MKLETLTPQQLQVLTEKREEWLAIGLNTNPADRQEAEEAVRRAYAAADLPAPQFYIWTNNPLEGAWAQGLLRSTAFWDQLRQRFPAQVWDQVWAQVGDQVRDQVWDQVGAQVRAQVRDQVRDQVGAQVWAQVWDQVPAQVWDQVGAQVRAQVWDQVGAQVRAQVWDQVWDQVGAQVGDWSSRCCWGQHDYWLSFYDTFDSLGVEGAQRIRGLVDVSRHAGWWWPLRGAVVLSERPSVLHRDQQGRLHCADGPAIAYPGGGFDMHFWHGTKVPGWVTQNPTVEQALGESNAEIRRCAIEAVGWDKLEDRLTLVSEEIDPGNAPHTIRLYDGELLRGLYEEPARVLLVHNASVDKGGSRRRFGLPVPAHHKTAVAAAADLFGVPVAAYRGLVRAS